MLRKKSEIWYHFSQEETRKAKCRYCQAILSTVGGSTGNLSRHLKLKHPTVPLLRTLSSSSSNENSIASTSITPSPNLEGGEKVLNLNPDASTSAASEIPSPLTSILYPSPKQSPMSKYVDIIKPVSIHKNKQIDTQLVKMIVKEFHPFSLVEDSEFRKFIQLLCPGYQIPSRKTVTNSLMPALYQSTLEKVKERLSHASAVCLTADGWTSINNQGFYAITVHFLDKDTRMCSNLLGCIEFSEKHTAVNISSMLLKCAKDWEIDFKVTAIVTDNAANIVAAVRQLHWRHIPCYAHTLNLIVQSGIKAIKNVVSKVKTVVQYFKQSSHALAKLNSVQKQMELPELKLKQDVITRWNSTYDMLTRVLKNKEPLTSTIALLQLGNDLIISSFEWSVIKHSVDMLLVFYEVTKEISSEKTVSLSKTTVLSRALAKWVKDCLETPELPEEVQNMGRDLLENLGKKFKDRDSNELVAQATLLDPRFKKQGFADEGKFREAYNVLVAKIRGINISANSVLPVVTKGFPESKSRIWEEFDESVKQLTAENNPTAASIVELDKYISEPLLPRTCDPLTWWNDRKAVYPRLYQVLLKRFCLTATSVPCERIFSKAGQILNEKRSRLSPSKLSMTLFLNSNLD